MSSTVPGVVLRHVVDDVAGFHVDATNRHLARLRGVGEAQTGRLERLEENRLLRLGGAFLGLKHGHAGQHGAVDAAIGLAGKGAVGKGDVRAVENAVAVLGRRFDDGFGEGHGVAGVAATRDGKAGHDDVAAVIGGAVEGDFGIAGAGHGGGKRLGRGFGLNGLRRKHGDEQG